MAALKLSIDVRVGVAISNCGRAMDSFEFAGCVRGYIVTKTDLPLLDTCMYIHGT